MSVLDRMCVHPAFLYGIAEPSSSSDFLKAALSKHDLSLCAFSKYIHALCVYVCACVYDSLIPKTYRIS